MAGYEEKNIQFRDDDFQLIQADKRIMDTKLESKPTTFFRDAIRRFCKNKSSVAAAIILAILIALAILVPLLSPHNITTVSTTEGFLAPKLFEAGTGFWDGTRSKTHIVYDTVNEVPALSDRYSPASIKQSLISLTVDPEPTYIDAASTYGKGGVIVFATDAAVEGKDAFLQSKSTSFTRTGGYKLDVVFSDEEGVADSRLGEYAVYLRYGEGEEDRIMIRDFSRDYSPISFDISAALEEKGLGSVNGQIVFDLYSGTGTIAQLAAAVAKKVVGVEIVEEAVAAAKENAKKNGLTNCTFLAGDVLKVLDDISEKPDMIILDPPRDGIHPKALSKIIDYGVKRIVYISCKPTSLARDLVPLHAAGYRILRSCSVDMFPHTANVESCVLLERVSNRKADFYVKLNVKMKDYYQIKDSKGPEADG